MGEVYRARDTKLNRDVALKILPEAFAQDPERLARFKREAQVLASLDHPYIGSIYGLEDADHAYALVLQLVDGPTLADQIARGAIPLDEALPIARQIAEAMEAAHEKGVIHRDLKPANIKLTSDGQVKVLDFGLAKLLDIDAPSQPRVDSGLTHSPTITTPAMTMAGVILGTAPYMSPEQAKGRPADKRSDVWAFGCVLFEMLTGRRAFDGEEVPDTLAAILMREPEWTRLPAAVPPPVRTLLRRCLEKDRRRRVADVSAIRYVLDDPSSVTSMPHTAHRPWWRAGVVPAAAALVMGAVVTMGFWIVDRQRSAVPAAPVRFTVETPTQPLSIQGVSRDIALTPDGRQIVYRTGSSNVTSGTQLAVRALDQLDAHILPGITGIRSPFISPDGHWIGFFEGIGGALKKVSILGGAPITLCPYVGNPIDASWGPDDRIIFATSDPSTGLLRVGAGGGDPQVLTTPDRAHGEADHVTPFILPGGRAVLFTILMQGEGIENAQIAVLDLQTGQKKILVRGGSDARYVDTGHLVYANAGTLSAVRFDLARLEVTGDPVSVLEQVTIARTTGTADVALSQTGTLAYVSGGASSAAVRTLTWVTRQGHEEPIAAPPRAYELLRISPDGTRVALEIRDQENDIWVWDLKRAALARLTFNAGADYAPVWTHDSLRIIFGSDRDGSAPNLYWQAADNTGTIDRLTTSPNAEFPSSISPDGSRLLFHEISPKTRADIDMLVLKALETPPGQTPAAPLGGAARSTAPLIQTSFTENSAAISPDGHWVAYQSNESGSVQIYVRPFPAVDGGHWQITTSGGTRPVWARSGRELFYEGNGALMTVALRASGTLFTAGNPAKLFDVAPYYFAGNSGTTYDVSDDGRFLMIKPVSALGSTTTRPHLVVVEHWTEELKQRVPVK